MLAVGLSVGLPLSAWYFVASLNDYAACLLGLSFAFAGYGALGIVATRNGAGTLETYATGV